ncbi:MAG: glycosyltransferase family 4 protein [Methanoregulaceae archaeon]|nr:glycosyltransferase family 4 protein [Methanoregulaceae archaeon]
MRIAFVYDAVYPFVPGGVERRIYELSRRLAGRGHDVHVYGMKFWEGEATLTRDGVTLHGICRPLHLYRNGKRSIFPALFFGGSVFFALIRERFDVIDCQQFPYTSALAAIVSRYFSRSPLIITWHEFWGDYWYEYLGFTGSAGKALEAVIVRAAIPTVAVSPLPEKSLKTIRGDRIIRLIPNGINIKEIQETLPSEQASDIIFAGRLIKEKHVDLILEAVKIIKETRPDIQCRIIGDGPERQSLEKKAALLGLLENVVFTGKLSEGKEVIALMKASRVFVIPSTREGFGISALEAMACGLPVVTSNDPMNAIGLLIDEKCGAVCDPDPRDLAEKLEVMLISAWENSGYCRLKAQANDWEAITSRLEQYYNEVGQGRSPV